MCFHSRWGEKTYLKAKNVENFTDVLYFMTAWSNYLFTQKRKRKLFPASFEVNLSAVVLPIVLKADLNFELILYITIFVFLSPGS